MSQYLFPYNFDEQHCNICKYTCVSFILFHEYIVHSEIGSYLFYVQRVIFFFLQGSATTTPDLNFVRFRYNV